MKILLTGASGYLGQHCLSALIGKASEGATECQIFATFGSMEGFEDKVMSFRGGKNVNVDQLDFTNKNDISTYFAAHGPFDLCLHLAALSSPKLCQRDSDKARAINVPHHLFDALKNTPIVALSTDQVYCGTKAPYLETSEAGPVNVYAQSKLDMENLLMNDEDRAKPTVCLRSSIILGPEAPFGGAHKTFLHFCQSRKGIETTFYTDEIRSVIAVKDVVNILLHFYDRVKSGKDFESNIYNMGGSDMASRMDMAIAAAKECGFSHDVFIAAEKAKQQAGDVPSPLDISMNSSLLEDYVGWKFSGLDTIVKETFA